MNKHTCKLGAISCLISFIILSGCKKDEQAYQSVNVTDRDGNIYHTVKIGNQVWLKENLKTRIGQEIKDQWLWSAMSSGNCNDPGVAAWAYYGNDSLNDYAYGKLYNYWAIGPQNHICPKGFHVPDMDEWQTLIKSLGGEPDEYGRDTIAGYKLKEEGNAHWRGENSGTNESGFTALPGGSRDNTGLYNGMGNRGSWWVYSNPTYIDGSPYYIPGNINIGGNNEKMVSFGYFPDFGFGYCIRCVRD